MTKDWKTVETLIRKLYLEQKKPLHEVIKIMSEQHGFTASYAPESLYTY